LESHFKESWDAFCLLDNCRGKISQPRSRTERLLSFIRKTNMEPKVQRKRGSCDSVNLSETVMDFSWILDIPLYFSLK
jgi:hypothetical protein